VDSALEEDAKEAIKKLQGHTWPDSNRKLLIDWALPRRSCTRSRSRSRVCVCLLSSFDAMLDYDRLRTHAFTGAMLSSG